MKTFEELGVSAEIRQAIEEMGYEQPMPVQEEVIPYLLGENNDVVALAQTGTGKTAAYGLPLIQKVDISHRVPQSLILCPTRELCLQLVERVVVGERAQARTIEIFYRFCAPTAPET